LRWCFCFLVLLVALCSISCRSPQTAYDAIKHEVDRGEFNSTLTQADAALRHYGPRNEEWEWRFRLLKARILLSRYPAPDKTEYIVKKGDVLARVAAKVKSTPELIMRMNSLNGTMLHIGERLLISHPEFSLFVQRKEQIVVMLDHGNFFKRYRVLAVKLPARQPPKITTRVAEVMAWKNGKRVGFGSKDYVNSLRWLRLAAPGYVLYADPNSAGANAGLPPPPQGLEMRASDLVEVSALVNNKTPVTITD